MPFIELPLCPAIAGLTGMPTPEEAAKDAARWADQQRAWAWDANLVERAKSPAARQWHFQRDPAR